MAIETECLTPGAVYRTHIQPTRVSVCVTGLALDITEEDAVQLEYLLHNQMELVLSQFLTELPSVVSTP